MQPSSQNGSRYAFILNSGKGSGLSLPGLNLPAPLKLGLLLIFLAIIILFLLLMSGTKSSPLTKVGAYQKEIARVAVESTNSAKSQNVKDLVATTDAIFSTAQVQTAKAIGISVNSHKLNLYTSKNTDSQLQAASQNGTFDQTYLQILKSQLQNYMTALQSASKQLPASSPTQALLTKDYQDAQTLLADPAFKGS